MVSARTAAFFALIVAAAPHIFASPLPLVQRVEGDVSEFSTIKAYERRALDFNEHKRSEGINMMPEEMPTSSDGVTMKMYGTRAIGDIGTTGEIATATRTTTTAGSVTGAAAAAPAGIVTVPAELPVSSDGTGAVPFVARSNSLFGRGFFSSLKPADAILPTADESTSISDEIATSSDGTGPVAIAKRAEGINLMPAEVATKSDGVTMSVFGRGILAQPEDHPSISEEIAPSSDGSGPVAIHKRAEGINMMPEEVATKSDGSTMSVFRRGVLAQPEDHPSISEEIATSSDGSGPVAIHKRAEGINLMPAEVATKSDGVTMSVFGRGILAQPEDHPSVSEEVATSSDGSGPVAIHRRSERRFQRRQVVAAGTVATTTATTGTVAAAAVPAVAAPVVAPVTAVAAPVAAPIAAAALVAAPTTDTTAAAILPTEDDVIDVPAEVATSSDGTGPVPIRKRAEGINLMPAEVATSSDGVTMRVFGQ